MKKALNGQKRISLCIFVLCLVLTVGSASATAVSLDEPLSHDASGMEKYLLGRIPSILDQLRRSNVFDKKLKGLISRIRFKAPSKSYYDLYPNAYAMPGVEQDFIIIEARFANQIAGQAAVGALFATCWKDAPKIFDGFAADYQRSYRDAVSKGKGIVVYQFDFDKYLGTEKNIDRLLIDKLCAFVAEETQVWFILHEIGHLALKHKAVPVTKAKSREREAAADRWASSAVKKLGYSLFGISQYLNGRAATESCLTELGLVTPENQSTHPSYATRFKNMVLEFDITAAPRCNPRIFFMPVMAPLPIEMYLIVPSSDSDDYRVTINQNYKIVQGVCEWDGNTVHVYSRSNTGGRMELIIPDSSHIYNKITWREYDPSNKLVNVTEWPAFQQSIMSFDFLQIGGGLTFADARERSRGDTMEVLYLRRVGTPEDVITKVVKVIKEFESAEKKIKIDYLKGKIGLASVIARITPTLKQYHADLIMLLGVDRYQRYRASIKDDVIMQWAPGSGADYKALEDEMIEKNFPSKKNKPIYKEKDRRLIPKLKAVPRPPANGLLSEAELLAAAKRDMKALRFDEAKILLTKGANAGYPGAQYNLGMLMIVLGQRDTGLYWLEQAAQQGHQEAIEVLRSLRDKQ